MKATKIIWEIGTAIRNYNASRLQEAFERECFINGLRREGITIADL